jgi:hypothetical protein
MRFTVTLKDPDCFDESVRRELERDLKERYPDLDVEEREALFERRYEKLQDFAGQWLKYGEYISIEFDTEAGTATVAKK